MGGRKSRTGLFSRNYTSGAGPAGLSSLIVLAKGGDTQGRAGREQAPAVLALLPGEQTLPGTRLLTLQCSIEVGKGEGGCS